MIGTEMIILLFPEWAFGGARRLSLCWLDVKPSVGVRYPRGLGYQLGLVMAVALN
jgi:hypothetical protein